MANLDQAIQYTQLFQDVEFSHALQQFRNNPDKLQRFLQESQDKLYKDITTQKDGTFQKVYGDLERASDTQRSVYYYHRRNGDLNKLQEQVYNSQKGSADALINDRDLAKRQYEINQWSSSNKMDTLFIYSQLFIILCTTILLGFVWQRGILPPIAIYIISFILVFIFIFTIVNRAQFTRFLRDGRFWNRRKFQPNKGLPIPNVCNGELMNSVSGAYDDLTSSARAAVKNASSGLQQGIGSAAAGLQQGIAAVSASV